MELESASVTYVDEDKVDRLTGRQTLKIMKLIDKLAKHEVETIEIRYKGQSNGNAPSDDPTSKVCADETEAVVSSNREDEVGKCPKCDTRYGILKSEFGIFRMCPNCHHIEDAGVTLNGRASNG